MTKITTKLDGKEITIHLTKEQEEDLKSQLSPKSSYKKYTDIKDILDAIDHLKQIGRPVSDEDFKTTAGQIKAFARAINSLIDDEVFPNFDNRDQKKWFPYYTKEPCGWVFTCSYCCYYCSAGQVGFCKTQSASDYAGKQIIDLYAKLASEY